VSLPVKWAHGHVRDAGGPWEGQPYAELVQTLVGHESWLQGFRKRQPSCPTAQWSQYTLSRGEGPVGRQGCSMQSCTGGSSGQCPRAPASLCPSLGSPSGLWTPHHVETAVWTWAVGQKLCPDLLPGLGPSPAIPEDTTASQEMQNAGCLNLAVAQGLLTCPQPQATGFSGGWAVQAGGWLL